ncbi:unnamed protein product [marine sediment metagenome]|uniref:Uncharacterized protein n=1 Tax=marine sediment metagenome TaxID=412755 RepID=X1FU53_9ZZZZ
MSEQKVWSLEERRNKLDKLFNLPNFDLDCIFVEAICPSPYGLCGPCPFNPKREYN